MVLFSLSSRVLQRPRELAMCRVGEPGRVPEEPQIHARELQEGVQTLRQRETRQRY